MQSNDAHFSSFISGLLLGESGPGEIRRGEIGLMNPQTGEPIPVEAIAGKVLTETGELTAVVTILHDRREALERARLYEQLKRGVRRAADARAVGDRGAGDAERAAAAAGDRAGAGVAR